MKKKELVITLLITLMSGIGFAQDNIFTQLKKYEGEEYKQFDIRYDKATDKLTIRDRFNDDSSPYTNSLVYIQENEFGKPMDFEIQKINGKNAPKTYFKSFGYTKYNHYAEPSIIGNTSKLAKTYVAVDGIIFEMEDAKDDLSSYGNDYALGTAYIPMSIVNKKSEAKAGKKKKGNFFNKMKSKLGNLLVVKAPEPLASLKTATEFRNYISTYLKSMKEKQANSPLSAKDKKDEQSMKLAADKVDKDIKNKNAEYWRKKAEEERKNGPSKGNEYYYVKNNTNNSIRVGPDSGSMFLLYKGSTYKVYCDKPVYRKVLEGSTWKNGAMISSGKNVCGKTIDIN